MPRTHGNLHLRWEREEVKTCEHILWGAPCGLPATAIIKVQQGALVQTTADGEDLPRGVGSRWIAVCEQHETYYPDFDGIKFRAI